MLLDQIKFTDLTMKSPIQITNNISINKNYFTANLLYTIADFASMSDEDTTIFINLGPINILYLGVILVCVYSYIVSNIYQRSKLS